MFAKIPTYSLQNRFLILLASVFLVLWGWRSFQELPIDAVPDLTNVQIQILTSCPGLAPTEVEKQVTYPIEQAMAGIPKLEEIRSLSQIGLSVITVVFQEGTDIHWARQIISQRLTQAREEIPQGYGTPSMGPLSTGLSEIFQFEIQSKKRTSMQLRTLLDWYIAPALRMVPGVIEVNSLGGQMRTYEVALSPQRLHVYNLSVTDILQALQQSNRNVGGGYIQRSGEQLVVRGEGFLKSLEDIKSLPLRPQTGHSPVKIGQIADVRFAPMPRQGIATRDGRGEVVTATVMMLLGANARDVVHAIKERIDQLKPGLPKDVKLDVFYDRSALVDRTLKTVRNNLIEGGILVIIVLFLLLGDLRGGLLVALTIPLSMLFALICMRWMGLSGNLMSLGAIDFGIIVDGAVVMVEHAVLILATRKIAWKDTTEAVTQAASEVSRPIAFSVGIIILVYLPILTLQNVEGKLFRPMAWTVIFALIGALLLSLTLIPVLASMVFPLDTKDHQTWLMRFFHWIYRPILQKSLRHPKLILGGALAIFFLSVVFATRMGAEFLPRLDEGTLAVQAQRLTSISLSEAVRQSALLERTLKQFPEVLSVISKTGRPEIATDPMGLYQSDVYINLKPRHTWRPNMDNTRLINAMKAALDKEAPGSSYSFTQPIEMRTAELLEGIRADIGIKIFGDDLALLRQTAGSIEAIVKKIKGAADVSVEATDGLPYLRIQLDYTALGHCGVSPDEALRVIESIGGIKAGTIFEKEKRFSLRVRFQKLDRTNLEAIRLLPVRTRNDKLLPLHKVARIWTEEGPVQIQREQGKRRIIVQINVRGRDLSSFVQEAKQAIAAAQKSQQLKMPEGFFIEWGGQFKQLASASQRLLVVVPLTLLLIFALLQIAFGSAQVTLLIYLNIPIAATGGIFALALRGMPLSISAAVGFIALFGIAVMNGVVLLSAIQQNQQEGHERHEAVILGAEERLRPVLMTALTDAIGFLPMAIATSSGAEVQRPLATVVIGGIFTSMLLTLFVLPSVYALWGPPTLNPRPPHEEPEPHATEEADQLSIESPALLESPDKTA
ncbi:MAG: efflux RND transporter permease subunit [Myxococcales bacterium]|nr:efflux RND transporter permease subunit [Myxococcales bacterium]MCB9643412.1 efflux RND transporter permease subunit [Myxococcales bacterium]